METEVSCFRDFPNQCEGCSQYFETRQNAVEQIGWLSGMEFAYQHPRIKIIKKCIAFNKQVVEYRR